MARTRRALLVLAILFSLQAPLASAQAAEPEQLWNDFAHYVLIARPQLASDAAQALLDADPGSLLDTVEASPHSSPANVFDRASGMEGVSAVAVQLQGRLESARLDRSRDSQRIQDNINRLDDGQRAFVNATGRLTAAGQYAAPQLLATLRDPAQKDLHPYVESVMVQVGQPLVAPLSVALPDLEPVAQRQVSQVLARIGYPYAMASLKRVLESADTDPTVRQHAQAAFDQLASTVRLPPGLSAAELYGVIGTDAYLAGTEGGAPEGFDSSKNVGLLWKFGRDIGLVPLEVPASVYADALARDAATTALSLNPDLDEALTLFLRADLRASNNLGDTTDPSRPTAWQPAGYYALLAGPQRLRDVLDTAIDDQDAALSLDAIDALSQTASIDALQPLVRALSYPDARVRFRAAEALAHAMPAAAFPDDHRVVPVLAEAMRSTEDQTALVLATDQDARNTLSDAVSEMGYTPIAAASLADATEAVRAAAGIDLVVVKGGTDRVAGVVEQTGRDYKLAGTPVLASVSAPDQTALAGRYGDDGRLTTFVGEPSAQSVAAATERAVARFSGDPLTEEQAQANALTALALLQTIAGKPSVYDASDALPTLIATLGDGRDDVATTAADVLAELNSSEAQAAIAASSLESLGDVQIAHLRALASSANRFGNLANAQAADALLELVRTSEGDLALAAAQAHGALALPTANAVKLLLESR